MAGMEITEEAREHAPAGSADILVGVAGPVAPEVLQARAERILSDLGSSFASLRFVFAWPGEAVDSAEASLNHHGQQPFALVPYAPPPRAGADLWSDVSASQRAVLSLAASLNARACIVIGSDLAALDAHTIQLFAYAIIERQCGLAMPVYPMGKYEGLVNAGILSPLIRALYGKRIRFPIAYDFAASGAMAGRLARLEGAHLGGNPLLWPVAVAAAQSPQAVIGQVHIDAHHEVSTQGLDLSTVLAQIVGSVFHDMEAYAPQWQRIRGSQAAPTWGTPPQEPADSPPIDPQPMLDSFLLGSKNLDEVWRLVLPPNTMLELRRLTRADASQFRIPDELWAGIVYDFALAWRLRTISRVHLLGALTPLYLGWVASYVREVSSLAPSDLEQRLESFARAWDEKKPYLLSRWRWPDRFIP